jgi:hypothetical protein
MPFTFKNAWLRLDIDYDTIIIYEKFNSLFDLSGGYSLFAQRMFSGTEFEERMSRGLRPNTDDYKTSDTTKWPYLMLTITSSDHEHRSYPTEQFCLDDDRHGQKHAHVRFSKGVDINILNKLLCYLKDSYHMFTQAEVDMCNDQWKKRHDADFQHLEGKLSSRKKSDVAIIIQHISTIEDIDTLMALHQHLLDKKFDYLREFTGVVKFSLWRGTDANNNEIHTTKSWAMIEKAISLQIVKIAPTSKRPEKFAFTESIGIYHPFLTIKRFHIPGQSEESDNASFDAFRHKDTKKVEEKHQSHFRKYR